MLKSETYNKIAEILDIPKIQYGQEAENGQLEIILERVQEMYENYCGVYESNALVRQALMGVEYSGTYADGVRALRSEVKFLKGQIDAILEQRRGESNE